MNFLTHFFKIEKVVYLKCLDICEVNILCKVSYDVKVELADDETTCNLEIQQDITLPVVHPFTFSSKFKSMKVNTIYILFMFYIF